jgi:hypothetical protein
MEPLWSYCGGYAECVDEDSEMELCKLAKAVITDVSDRILRDYNLDCINDVILMELSALSF